MRALALILFLSFFHQLQAQSITTEELKEELEFIVEMIHDLHPTPNEFTPRDQFEQFVNRITEVEQTNDSVDLFTCYQYYSQLVSKTKCCHSGAYLQKKQKDKINEFPIPIRLVNGKAIVSGTCTGKAGIEVGDKITAINGVPWSLLFEQGKSLHSSGGNTKLNAKKFERKVHIDIPILLKNPYTYTITLNRNGEKKTITPRCSRMLDEDNPAFEFTLSDSINNLGIITVRSFLFKKGRREFEKFCHRTVKKIKRKKISDVVIDIRDNGGGDHIDVLLRYFARESFMKNDSVVLRSENLLKYDEKVIYSVTADSNGYHLPKNHYPMVDFQGKMRVNANLYVFVNGYTASAASHFTSLIKHHELGKIAGQETGGRYIGNNGTAYAACFLPHSEIEIFFPLARNYYAVAPTKEFDRGVLPDIPIPVQKTKKAEMELLLKEIIERRKK